MDPTDDTGGIYILEDADVTLPHRETREVPMSNVRMRGRREKFDGMQQYRDRMPSQTMLRSRQRGSGKIYANDWDDRPPGFRPDDGPRASAFVPPPDVRPPSGGYRTPWQTSWAPPNSIAVLRESTPDMNMVGLAPCAPPLSSDPLRGSCAAEGFTTGGRRENFSVGAMTVISFVKLMMFLIIIVLLSILVTAVVTEKRCMANIREQIREALAELKR
ncbi:MAG: hypothetical protein KGL39_10855 [Patescibacteria group bacterium]|nr:hypothetical protein [Patescibacteria group bacterium]